MVNSLLGLRMNKGNDTKSLIRFLGKILPEPFPEVIYARGKTKPRRRRGILVELRQDKPGGVSGRGSNPFSALTYNCLCQSRPRVEARPPPVCPPFPSGA